MAEGFHVVGIDGGGSKTECAIVDQDARCVGLGRGGPSSLVYSGTAQAVQSVVTAIGSALASFGGCPSVVLTACTHHLASSKEIVEAVTQLLGGEVGSYSELEAALGAVGIFERTGIVHVAGTGTSTQAFGRDGTRILVGGWGMFLGDEGGGFDIAVKGLRAAVRALDGRGPQTQLLGRATRHFGLAEDRDSFYRFAALGGARHVVATFSPEVTAAAREGDAAAKEIIEGAIRHHVASILAMARKLFTRQDAFPVALHGGVMSEDYIAESVARLVAQEYPNADVRRPIYSPAEGLALFALRDVKSKAAACAMSDERKG